MRAAPESVQSVGGALLEQGMRVEEVRSVLDAEDPAVVRRHLELHRERLAERLEERLRTVDRLEDLLLERTDRRRVPVRAG
jgi:DNA-binding transcriptional MerR regulator